MAEVQHGPICGTCLVPWPCPDHQHAETMRKLSRRVSRVCPGCGKVVQNGQARKRIGDAWFHDAKHRKACRRAQDAAQTGMERP